MFQRFLSLFRRTTKATSEVPMHADRPVPVKTEFTRMTPDVYQDFAKRFPGPARPADAFEAGYLLGVQMVLQKLREGYVIGQDA